MAITIPDEFEVEYATNYSASYNDDIMSGSMFALGGRTKEGSHVSGSNWIFKKALTATSVSFSDFYNHRLKYNIGLNYKFNTSNCQSEVFADSVLPDMMNIALINGAKRVYNSSEGFPSFINGIFLYPNGAQLNIKIVLGYADLGVTGTAGAQISDNTWLQTFPFEFRYRSIVRRSGLQTFSVATDFDENLFFIVNDADVKYVSDFFLGNSSPNQFALEFLVNASSSYAFRGGTDSPGDWSNIQHKTLTEFFGVISTASLQLFTTTSYQYSEPTNVHKHFFGFGDSYRNQVEFQKITSSDGLYTAPSYLYGQGAIIRGWKYGIISGVPLQTRAVWRRSKYGQFRDMLEQRTFTKFYDPIGLNLDGTLGGVVGAKSSVIDIRFISGSNAYVTASLSASLNTTESGIYDFEYKSIKPFFDT